MSKFNSPSSRVLVVEDNWILAEEIGEALRAVGLDVLGPAGTVADALALIAADEGEIGAAVLDVNLRGETVTPVTDALARLGIPFLYVTGYARAEPCGVRDGAPWLVKPVRMASLISVLEVMGVGGSGASSRVPQDHPAREQVAVG